MVCMQRQETGGEADGSTEAHRYASVSRSLLILTSVSRSLLTLVRTSGRQLGCYKVILDCTEDNVNFYTKCGFKQKEVQMVAYIPGNEQPRPRL